jgi:hypothetical protein
MADKSDFVISPRSVETSAGASSDKSGFSTFLHSWSSNRRRNLIHSRGNAPAAAGARSPTTRDLIVSLN